MSGPGDSVIMDEQTAAALDETLAPYKDGRTECMGTTRHHEFPDTYADDWVDCLVVGEGFVEHATFAEYWGGPEGAAMVGLADRTDGPVTRVRFITDDLAPVRDAYPEGSRFRLKPDEQGDFAVSEYHEGMGPLDCVVMRAPDVPFANAASVEKWVPRELRDTLFPIGRRFGLERVGEG